MKIIVLFLLMASGVFAKMDPKPYKPKPVIIQGEDGKAYYYYPPPIDTGRGLRM